MTTSSTLAYLGGDLKLIPKGKSSNPQVGPSDFEIIVGATDVTRDAGLETLLLISLFTNASANADDTLPANTDSRGGHFSENILGKKFGSRLWLLRRSNLTQATLNKAKEYCEEAIDRHIIDEGIAKDREVEVLKDGKYAQFNITIIGQDKQTVVYQYYLNWQRQLGKV